MARGHRWIGILAIVGLPAGVVTLAWSGTAPRRDRAQVVEITPAALRALPEWRIGQPVLRIGENQSGDASWFHIAGLPVRFSDGTIAVPNEQKEIRYYDANGRFVHAAGQQGQGPGDFRQLWSVHPLAGDSLLAFDIYAAPASRFSVFSPRGRYVRQYEIDARSSSGLIVLPDRAVVRAWSDGSRRRAAMNAGVTGIAYDTALVIRTEVTGKADTITRVPASPLAIINSSSWTGVVLAASSLLAGGPAGLVTGFGDAFELHWFDLAGKPLRVLRVDEPRVRVTDETKARYERSQPAPSRAVAREPGPRPTVMYASRLPVIARIRMDRAGRLWVRRWTFDDEPTAEWILFTAAGRPLARMRFPGTFNFQDADTNYVLGRYTDSDGVQSVRMYRPGP